MLIFRSTVGIREYARIKQWVKSQRKMMLFLLPLLCLHATESLENDAKMMIKQVASAIIGNNVIVLWLVIGLFWFDVQGFRLGVSTTLHIHLPNLIPSPLKPAASAYFRQHLQRPSKLAFAFLFWHKLTKQAARMERVKRFLFFKQTKNKHKLWKVKQTHIRRASTSIL